MFWLLTAVVLLALIVVMWKLLTRGIRHDLLHAPDLIAQLLKRGYDGGYMSIVTIDKEAFVYYRKWINAPGDYGINMIVPEAIGGTKLMDCVVVESERLGLSTKLKELEKETRALFVELDRDLEKANQLFTYLFKDLLNYKNDDSIRVCLEHASPKDELIDA